MIWNKSDFNEIMFDDVEMGRSEKSHFGEF